MGILELYEEIISEQRRVPVVEPIQREDILISAVPIRCCLQHSIQEWGMNMRKRYVGKYGNTDTWFKTYLGARTKAHQLTIWKYRV